MYGLTYFMYVDLLMCYTDEDRQTSRKVTTAILNRQDFVLFVYSVSSAFCVRKEM